MSDVRCAFRIRTVYGHPDTLDISQEVYETTNLQATASVRQLEELGTSVLFDVAAEAATELGGTYMWLQDHAATEQEAQGWRATRLQLRRERRELHPDDRSTVIAAVRRWGSERRRLDEQHGLR